MSTLPRRDRGSDPAHWFNRMFEEWARPLPMRGPWGLNWDWPDDDLIRVDHYRDGNTEVIRAELPGIDPDKDIEITVTDGTLRIDAERRVETKTKDKGYVRNELSYGSLTRTLPLPEASLNPTSPPLTTTASSRSASQFPSRPRANPRRSPSPRAEPSSCWASSPRAGPAGCAVWREVLLLTDFPLSPGVVRTPRQDSTVMSP
ncbi:MAG: Hsp20/alpha crystallin family protein [Pseudonocardia sp.]|nr:Hsp20/alpha crystallin family protein [Pseudonocardia sp.]